MNQTGDRQAAIVLCGEALEEFPEERAFYVTLGGLHAEDERFEESDLAYEAARTGERDEDYYLALYMQARMRIEGGFEPQRAIELLEEFILAEPTGEFVPSTASALWRQGVAHELAGEPDRARRCYGLSLELDPDFDKASEALGDLDEEGA